VQQRASVSRLEPIGRAETIRAEMAQLIAEDHRILARLTKLAAELAAEVRLAESRRDAAISERMPDLLSAQEIARRLSLSERQVYVLMDDGLLGQIRRIGTRRLVAAEDYLHYLDTTKVG
jgi:hypothetical protein